MYYSMIPESDRLWSFVALTLCSALEQQLIMVMLMTTVVANFNNFIE